jgi:hypothetical protein
MISKLVHYSPLTDMFTRIIENQTEATPLLLADRFQDFARSFATVRLVEQCATACEMLAEELCDDPEAFGLQGQLSECVAICAAFLGASVRESKHAYRYAMIFSDVCAETAEASSAWNAKSARCVEVMCRASVSMVREDYGAVAVN